MACDLVKLATPGVAGLHPYQPGKSVGELERELGINNIIKHDVINIKRVLAWFCLLLKFVSSRCCYIIDCHHSY